MAIGGVEVPADLDEAISAHGGETFNWIFDLVEQEPWRFFEHFAEDDGQRYADRFLGGDPLEEKSWQHIDHGNPSSWRKDECGCWEEHAQFDYAAWLILHAAISTAMAQGFFLALVRYADELKHVPEAAAMIQQRQAAAKKGGEGRRKKAAPNHKAIQKRFRELRKTVPKKTARYLRVADEFGMSDRHVARIVDGID
jgi:hypothetical protein